MKKGLKMTVLSPSTTAFQSNVLESSTQISPEGQFIHSLNVSLPKLQLLTGFSGDIYNKGTCVVLQCISKVYQNQLFESSFERICSRCYL